MFDILAKLCLFTFYFIANDDKNITAEDDLNILCIFNILTKCLASRIFLKAIFYRHHYLSLGIFFFFLIILSSFEIFETEFNGLNNFYIIATILSSVFYSLEDVIGKKILNYGFLNPYSLLSFKGLYGTFILLLFSIPLIFIKRDEEMIFNKLFFFMNTKTKILLNIGLLVTNCLYNICIWIIIDDFSVNDLALTTIFSGIITEISKIFSDEKKNIIITISTFIIYFILIIGVCIHNEIIIINKCGLNEYTKIKIGKKGAEEVRHINNPQRYTFTTNETNDELISDALGINDIHINLINNDNERISNV